MAAPREKDLMEASSRDAVPQIDELCDGFEQLWKEGVAPALEEFVATVGVRPSVRLLRELVLIDAAYRVKRRESPNVKQYLDRFEELRGEVDALRAHWPAAEDVHARRPDVEQTATFAPQDPGPADGSKRPLKPRGETERFTRLRLHATGGLGEVYIAHDHQLHRDVAVKEMKPRFASHQDAQARFLIEAEVTGRLEHPGVVPIYSLSAHEDGRPFYAMRFIRGCTLKEEIDRLHSQATDPWVERTELFGLLNRFIVVCQTLDYAHARGVLHRDVKPSNIMVGPYGETLLVDWGLAKVLGESAGERRKGETTLLPSSYSGSSNTLAGSAVGTPAYMSPEQASGELDDIGPASDVYSLGATLYHLLTGRAPIAGDSIEDVISSVQKGEFSAPRLLDRRIPRSLEAICLKAMQRDPKRRYASAHALAVDVQQWLADEPVSAYRDPFIVRCFRWARRHRSLVSSAAAMATALACVGGIWNWRERSLLETNRSAATKLLEQARSQTAQEQLAQANLLLVEAKTRLGSDERIADLRRLVGQALEEVEGKIAVQQARRAAGARLAEFRAAYDDALFHGTLITGLEERDRLAAASTAAKRAAGLLSVDLEAPRAPSLDSSFVDAETAQEIREALYELTLLYVDAVGRRRSASGPSNDAVHWSKALGILDQSQNFGFRTKVHHVLRERILREMGRADEARDESLRAQAEKPSLAVDYFLLGEAEFSRGRFAPAIEHYLASLRIRPKYFWAHYFAAAAYLELDRPEAALPHLAAMKALRQFAWNHILAGYALARLGRMDDAEEEYRQAILISPREFGVYLNRAVGRLQAGRLDEALADLQTASAIFPNAYQVHLNLAEAHRRRGQAASARASIARALELSPRNRKCLRVRGLIQWDGGDLAGALADFDAALASPAANPREAAEDHFQRGRILHRLQRFADARAAYSAALQLNPDHAEALRLRADVLIATSQGPEAIAALDEYILLRRDDAKALEQRGFEKAKLGRHGDAANDFQTALARDPQNPLLRGRIAWIYLNHGPALAQEQLEQALKLRPDDPDLLIGRAYARVLLDRMDEGVADAERAVRLCESNRPQDVPWSLYFNAACTYSQACARQTATAPKTGRRPTWDLAFAALDKSLGRLPVDQRGVFLETVIEKEPALAPLRSRPNYAEWRSARSKTSPKNP